MKIIYRLYDRIFPGTAAEARGAILRAAEKKSVVTVQFAYYAALKMDGWYRERPSSAYEAALFGADFLLIDGIALQLLHYRFRHPETWVPALLARYRHYRAKSLPNLNGTDFVPFFLDAFDSKEDFRLVLYGTFPEVVEQAAEFARARFGFETVFQNGYEPFDFSLLSADKTNLLLVGTGAPRQEIWSQTHRAKIAEHGRAIVFGVGGLIDRFGGLEKRAPKWMRDLSLEWLWRICANPKKNGKKVLTSFFFFWDIFR